MHDPEHSPISRGQWLTLTAALLGWFFDGFEMGVFPIVARDALRELLHAGSEGEELVRHWYAIVSAAFLFGAAFGGFLFGWLGDRIGRVKAMAFSVLTYALLTGACGFAQSALQLTILRFLAAMGMGGEWALGVALLAESWPNRYRPWLAGGIGAVANLGYVFVALLSLAIVPKEQWRYLLMICAFPAVLTFILRLYVPESEKWQHAASTGPKPKLGDIFVGLSRYRALIGASIGSVALFATWGAVQFTQPWAAQMTGGKVPHAPAYVQICSASAASLGAFFAPVLLQRVSRRWSYALLCIGSFISTQMLFNLNSSFDVLFMANVALVGVLTASFYGWLPLYLPELFPTRIRAAGQGFAYNAGRILSGIGLLVITYVLPVSDNYPRACSIVCCVFLFGILIARAIPETLDRPLPE